ncbi:hypothetical protein BH11ACT8_BH11ACT8_32770 [soil metagenome]
MIEELSRRELQVLGLIVRGHTNREISDELFLSINSVKTYIRTTYRKIGVTRRPQAILWGVRNGVPIVSDEDRERRRSDR